jgi:hypothetical protein
MVTESSSIKLTPVVTTDAGGVADTDADEREENSANIPALTTAALAVVIAELDMTTAATIALDGCIVGIVAGGSTDDVVNGDGDGGGVGRSLF